MINLWVQVNIDSKLNEFWYIDYENGTANRTNQRPQFESIRKWKGTIENFLNEKGIKAIKENENTIKFETTMDSSIK